MIVFRFVLPEILRWRVMFSITQTMSAGRWPESQRVRRQMSAGNAIRPFVLDKKNWLFVGIPRRAGASCVLY